MSFSSQIKEELNKTSSLSNKELVKYELIGYLISANIDIIEGKKLKFSTENDYNINRYSKLLDNLNINHDISVTGKTFIVEVKIKDIKNLELIEIKENNHILLTDKIKQNDENLKSIIKGIFLGSGSINNPENKYHLEIVIKEKQNLEIVMKMLEKLGIKVKELQTKNKNSIYIKEGEEISKFLALIGATKAILEFEEIRVKRELRGKVNRLVNCETANLNKTINASIEQISAIKELQSSGKFNKLDENLKEIAILRLENPDATLSELGKMLKNPIGKSGVNYRLKRILEIAKNANNVLIRRKVEK